MGIIVCKNQLRGQSCRGMLAQKGRCYRSSSRHLRIVSQPGGCDHDFAASFSFVSIHAQFCPKDSPCTPSIPTKPHACRFRYRFGSSVIAISACYSSRSLTQIQMFSPYQLSCTHPAYGCQKGALLTIRPTPSGVSLRC